MNKFSWNSQVKLYITAGDKSVSLVYVVDLKYTI